MSKQNDQRNLLKPREAAWQFNISERQLWAKTSPRGPIPCVRIGKSVRYCPVALRKYIDGALTSSSQEAAS